MYRQLMGIWQVSRRTITSSARRQMENTVKEKQKLFQEYFSQTSFETWNERSEQEWRYVQEDNGLPIHLKGGLMDGLLYRTTMTLTVFGSGYVVYELYTAAMPKKP